MVPTPDRGPLRGRWPRGIGTPDRWIREPAHVMDVMPTLVEAAGARYPASFRDKAIAPMEGHSLLPLLRGGRLPERSMGFSHEGARALRKGDSRPRRSAGSLGPLKFRGAL